MYQSPTSVISTSIPAIMWFDPGYPLSGYSLPLPFRLLKDFDIDSYQALYLRKE